MYYNIVTPNDIIIVVTQPNHKTMESMGFGRFRIIIILRQSVRARIYSTCVMLSLIALNER